MFISQLIPQYSFFILKTYLLDSIYTRRKLNDIAEKILPGWSSQYSTIEHEMNLSPDWPPPVSRESSRTNGYLRMESFNESETVELLMQVDSGSDSSLHKSNFSLSSKRNSRGDNFIFDIVEGASNYQPCAIDNIQSKSIEDVRLLDS